MTLEEAIKKAVCMHTNVSPLAIGMVTRKREIVTARFICFYLYKKVYQSPTGLARTCFALFSRNADHTTVIHGINMVYDQIDVDPKFGPMILEIKQTIDELLNNDLHTKPISDIVDVYQDLQVKAETIIPYNNCANF